MSSNVRKQVNRAMRERLHLAAHPPCNLPPSRLSHEAQVALMDFIEVTHEELKYSDEYERHCRKLIDGVMIPKRLLENWRPNYSSATQSRYINP